MGGSSGRIGRRRFLALGAGLLGSAWLGGCTEDDATPTPSPSPSTTTLGAIRLHERPGHSMTSRQSTALSFGTLQPSTGRLSEAEQFLIYSRLVAVDPRSSFVHGELAAAVEVVEPLLLRVSLRPDLYFHPSIDGGPARPLDAEAVALDFERRRSEGVFLFSQVIQQVEARGALDLVFRLNAPFGLFFEYLARADASVRGSARYGNLDVEVGSGPFVPAVVEGADHLLGANPLLRGGDAPNLRQLLVRGAVSEGQLDAMFVGGETHLRVHPDAVSREGARLRADRVEVSRPARTLRALAVSLAGHGDEAGQLRAQRLQDRRVRQAISTAIDRAALRALDDAFPTGPVGPAHAGDALSVTELGSHPVLRYSPGEARKLLTSAEAEGMTLRIAHPNTPAMLPVAHLVGQQLRDAGFDARLMPLDAAELDAMLTLGDFEAALIDIEGLSTPDLGLRLHTSGGLDGHRSPWGYSNPVYDAAVVTALSELDPQQRARQSRAAQRILLDDAPALIPLTAPREYASLIPGVEGYEFDGYDFNTGHLAPAWSGPIEVGT